MSKVYDIADLGIAGFINGPEFEQLGYSDIRYTLSRIFASNRNAHPSWQVTFSIDYRGSFSHEKVQSNSIGKIKVYKFDKLASVTLIIAEKYEIVDQKLFALEFSELILQGYDELADYISKKKIKCFDTQATRQILCECIEQFLEFESFPEDMKDRSLKIQALLKRNHN